MCHGDGSVDTKNCAHDYSVDTKDYAHDYNHESRWSLCPDMQGYLVKN